MTARSSKCNLCHKDMVENLTLRESHDRLLEVLRGSNKVIASIPTGYVWPDKKRQLELNREAITEAEKLQEGK